MRHDKKVISLFEIFLIVLSGVAFAYIISESNSLIETLPVQSNENKIIKFVREKTLNYLSKGMVSAQTSIQTCLLDNSGSYCQEYSSTTCESNCTSSCFPGRREDFSSCQLGSCFDSNTGLCIPNSPKGICEDNNGEWSATNQVQCNRGCCLINPDGAGGASQARLTTNMECNNLGQTSGNNVEWDSSIITNNQCVSRVSRNLEGACVLGLAPPDLIKYNCRFTTESSCITSGGTFYVGQLCTNPQLNTVCERTRNTKCYNDKVYFIDSCDPPNRANIYDSSPSKIDNIDYWSSVVNPSQSCLLASGNNNMANQQKCGNCDYLAGNVCGTPQPNVDRNPNAGQFVCKDLSCIDSKGVKRQHQESWCVFDSRIGLDGAESSNAERSVDVVGSNYYRERCYEGEVILEPCKNYRNEVCIEGVTDTTPAISSARCVDNNWNSCILANEDSDELGKCEENPICFLKRVDVESNFKFDVCAPKYPPAFEIKSPPKEDVKETCAIATQSCKYFEKKSLSGRWSCKKNCNCNSAEFVETMNNLCMSLGDCGGSANLAGEYTKNYIVSGDRTPSVGANYIEKLIVYANAINGQKVDYDISLSGGIFNTYESNGPSSGFWRRADQLGREIGVAGYFPPLRIVIWVYGAITSLFGVGKYRERKVNFECLPWRPPAGGDDCAKCNELGVSGECNTYKCASLGKNCKLLNPNNIDERVCVNINPNDISPPVIDANPSVLVNGVTYTNVQSNVGFKVNSDASDGCFKENSLVTFGVKLNEEGQCKISETRDVEFKDMDRYFDSGNGDILNHTETIGIPRLDDFGLSNIDPSTRHDYDLYVRCEDSSGNDIDYDYVVRFCIAPEDDLTPPVIRKFVPESPGIVGYNSESFNLRFYTNEPATCRFSSTEQEYSTMENEANCDTEFGQATPDGMRCLAVLNVTQPENIYYFRCADKPWLGEDCNENSCTPEVGRNVAGGSEEYRVRKTATPLEISSITPNDKVIFSAAVPVSVNLNIATSGGIDNGRALCRFSLNGLVYHGFRNTDSSTHTQPGLNLYEGEHIIGLRCEDRARNIAIGNSTFRIEVDSTGPLITRVYRSGNSLTVVTNEDSICEYSLNSCAFEFESGTALIGAGKSHTMPYTNGLTYRIKCRDIYQNVGSCLSVTGGY